jgi:pimeloyl-ACP methyl ester carboxylesterase
LSWINQCKLETANLNPVRSEAVHEYVRSKDGTRIGYSRLGQGPSVVFVHGSLSMGSDWQGVAACMSRQFTCFLMDRRGHGRSEAGASAYSVAREYEDVVAVLFAAGDDACLFGHSYGAICAMGAAMRISVRRLVLYEPPLPVGGLVAGENFEPFYRSVADGRLDDALDIGLRKFVEFPDAHVHKMRSSRSWPRLASQVPSWPRELKAMDGLPGNVSACAALTCPTLLLLGTETPEHPFRHAFSALAQTLPNVRTASLPGQTHMPSRSAQGLIAQRVSVFLSA